jgi:5,10-methylenetetrahydromethanopterin reductase
MAASSRRSLRTLDRPMKFDVAILGSQPVPTIVEQVKLAESLGYDTAWITDTHLVCRELWVTLTACALATSRIRLGPGITVPHTRHISVTASAAASLDELAPGRVVVGVGTGGSAAQTMGLTLAQTARTATLEAMATDLRRLTRRETVRFETGADGRLAWLREPRAIPIYAAGSGPRMLAAAGRAGDGVIMYASVQPEILRAGLAHVAAGARSAERRRARAGSRARAGGVGAEAPAAGAVPRRGPAPCGAPAAGVRRLSACDGGRAAPRARA